MRRMGLVIILLTFVSSLGFPDEQISFSASVDKTKVSMNEEIVLSLSISGTTNVSQPVLPPLPDFNIYSSGRSQKISIINGNVSTSLTFRYILIPKKVGRFTIGKAKITYKGKVYTTQPIEVEVVPALISQSKQLPPPSSSEARAREVFIEQVVDKKKVYVNEQIRLSFRIYQSVDFLENPEYHPPSLTGFWQEKLEEREYYKWINGQRYLVSEINTALFPISPGKYTIGSAGLTCTIKNDSARFPKSIWDWDPFTEFFGQAKRKRLHTQPLEIEVIPLPANAPSDFKGAVGRFSLSVDIDKKEAKVGEPITLTLKIKGEGNLKSLTSPQLPSLSYFKQYTSEGETKILSSDKVIQGEKSYQYILIPQKEGDFTIPAFTFSYFDPQKKTYQRLRTEAISVHISPSPTSPSTSSLSRKSARENSPSFSPDLSPQKNYLLVVGNKIGKGIFILGEFLYTYRFSLLFLLIISLLLLYLKRGYRRYKERRGKERSARRRFAYTMLKRRLREIDRYMRTPDEKKEEFYALLFRALSEYLAECLGVSRAGITIAQIEDLLREKGIKDELVRRIRACLEQCESQRFAPYQDKDAGVRLSEMRTIKREVEEIIKQLRRCGIE
ncbi:MAG: hypothetical protein DRP75_03785 [Candidatus Omnitrophota bacterium]|nr:MAG: hypothetical protein DRP75_03785 [Candidatus Omnitrophota bacterium]